MDSKKCVQNSQVRLEAYLDVFLQNTNEQCTFPRIKCCGTSRALYCTDCSRLLIDRDRWPASIQSGKLQLPFHLDVILSDRRRSSTGFHALVLLRASQGYYFGSDSRLHTATTDTDPKEQNKEEEETIRLFDLEQNDVLPNYESKQNQHQHQQSLLQEDTFVLFPSKTSVPISAVAKNIKRLIVLDCKWTKSSISQKLPQISNLPQVHLEYAPSESYYWRWHNAGPGMISTLEAIYFAAIETVVGSSCVSCDDGNKNEEVNDYHNIDKVIQNSSLMDLMWLFGIQRASTALGARREGKPLPFSTVGKAAQRDLRKTEKGSEKHLRDIANGQRLKYMCQLQRQKELGS